ncbi:MAG: alcohol dehydrogenase catalytic domain-containing protein [Actinomycetaceae bacterium]|nr:alcohol dehydrogenase catalytic domain-containing protein [Actinomycetaceae bacterium]
MKAAVLNSPGDLQLVTREDPKAGPGEVIIRTAANTLCGTDYRLFTGAKTAGVRPGVVPGHEVSGFIFEIDEGAAKFLPGVKVGQQATVSIVVSCGACRNCLRDMEHLCENLELFGYGIDGGLQEYIRVPARAVARGNVIVTDRELDPKALCLAEPLSCCLNGIDNYRVEVGDTVVVLGAGPIGLLHTQLAFAMGAGRVIVSNRSKPRRDLAEKFGAIGVDPSSESLEKRVRELTGGDGADAVVVCIGAPELADEALILAREGGRVNYFAGFPKGSTSTMEPNLIHYKELQVTGGSNARRRDVKRAIKILESGAIDVDAMITHEFPLSKVHDAYDAVKDRVGVKIAVVPD